MNRDLKFKNMNYSLGHGVLDKISILKHVPLDSRCGFFFAMTFQIWSQFIEGASRTYYQRGYSLCRFDCLGPDAIRRRRLKSTSYSRKKSHLPLENVSIFPLLHWHNSSWHSEHKAYLTRELNRASTSHSPAHNTKQEAITVIETGGIIFFFS